MQPTPPLARALQHLTPPALNYTYTYAHVCTRAHNRYAHARDEHKYHVSTFKKGGRIDTIAKEKRAAAMERLSVDRLRADEKLIEGVKRYPCLWEIHNKSFRDLGAKESAWKIVAQEVGRVRLSYANTCWASHLNFYMHDCGCRFFPQVGYSDEDCLKRWKSLRDRFVREAKKVKENATSDGGSGYVPPWSLFHSMTFLMDSIRHRK